MNSKREVVISGGGKSGFLRQVDLAVRKGHHLHLARLPNSRGGDPVTDGGAERTATMWSGILDAPWRWTSKRYPLWARGIE